MKIGQAEVINIAKRLVQPLLPQFHKGQAGRICVIGGCGEYAGAPYFSAHAAASIGADLVHIICGQRAGPTIQLYLPDLMVHPYLIESPDADVGEYPDLTGAVALDELRAYADKHVMPKVMGVISRSDFVVLGPGLGRDPLMMATAARIIEETKVHNLPLLVDADGLYLASLDPKLILHHRKTIITPNVVEFARLADAAGVELSENGVSDDSTVAADAMRLSQALGGVLVVRKGPQEVIAKNNVHLFNTVSGSLRRVGGQGDTLSGTIACLVNWLFKYSDRKWNISPSDPELLHDEANIVAATGACAVVRTASKLAFEKHGRLMQTSHVHESLHQAYQQVYE